MLTTGISMYGKMSTGMVTMAVAPSSNNSQGHHNEGVGAAEG